MSKVLIFIGLALFATSVLACSSMSLDDYAEECGEWNEDYSSIYFGSVRDAEDALADWQALSPPGEVKQLHDLRESALKLYVEMAKEREALEDDLEDLQDELDDARRSQRDDIRDEMDDLRDDAEDRMDDLQDQLDDLSDDWEDAEEDLSRRERRDLQSEGCL